jgi:hypothetical protein
MGKGLFRWAAIQTSFPALQRCRSLISGPATPVISGDHGSDNDRRGQRQAARIILPDKPTRNAVAEGPDGKSKQRWRALRHWQGREAPNRAYLR